MTISVVNNYKELSLAAADSIARIIATRERPVLGFATGSTPLGMYQDLVARYRAGKLDFSHVITFNLDEYLGLKPTDPRSYHRFMWENLFGRVNVRKENVFIPRGDAEDAEAECRGYEELIRLKGPIDVQILGLGVNGHIGFNEPGTPFTSRTRVVDLTDETVKANARFFGDEREVPRKAITMGIGTILEARQIVLVASGRNKAHAVAGMIAGPVTEEAPASALRQHPDVTAILDREAASAALSGLVSSRVPSGLEGNFLSWLQRRGRESVS
ncbi:MAG: glucosamine-6-phosphate deaminase [Bacteroidota bacterium]